MKKEIIVFGLLAASLSCMAQTEVNNYTPGINAEGVTYFLPQTVIDIKLEAEKVTYIPGVFCDYANKYLRLQGVSGTPDTHWIIKKVEVKTTGIPDPEKGFTVKLKDKSIAPLVELTDDGILVSINKEISKSTAATPSNKDSNAALALNPKDILSEEILSATSKAKMAELVAKEIYNIRDSKNAIIRGQADNMPQDGESLKIMLSNLDAQDAALTNMFKGETTRESKILAIRLTPGEDINKQVLFRFSKKLGIVSAADLGGEPIYYDLKNLNSVPLPEDKNKKAKRPQGIVYNLPGKAAFKIYQGNKVHFESELPIAQFGNTEVLANELFNKGATTQVSFDPSSGGLIKIERE